MRGFLVAALLAQVPAEISIPIMYPGTTVQIGAGGTMQPGVTSVRDPRCPTDGYGKPIASEVRNTNTGELIVACPGPEPEAPGPAHRDLSPEEMGNLIGAYVALASEDSELWVKVELVVRRKRAPFLSLTYSYDVDYLHAEEPKPAARQHQCPQGTYGAYNTDSFEFECVDPARFGSGCDYRHTTYPPVGTFCTVTNASKP
jgi:hypothetical protein